MNIKQTASKYGVPTPETCKELDWQGETQNYWVFYENEWYFHTKASPFFEMLLRKYNIVEFETAEYFRKQAGKTYFKDPNYLRNWYKSIAYSEILQDIFEVEPVIDGVNFIFEGEDYEIYPAPQMQEIAPLLLNCDLLQFKTGFELGHHTPLKYIHINGTNLAEMYAKMYIEQRKLNLI